MHNRKCHSDYVSLTCSSVCMQHSTHLFYTPPARTHGCVRDTCVTKTYAWLQRVMTSFFDLHIWNIESEHRRKCPFMYICVCTYTLLLTELRWVQLLITAVIILLCMYMYNHVCLHRCPGYSLFTPFYNETVPLCLISITK